MSIIFIIFAMIFCHIVDDYYLQGWLASAKQMRWWGKNAPERLYRYDYIMALIIHSISWSFMILLPYAVHKGLNVGLEYLIAFLINLTIHAFIDNLKCNKMKINLIIDQIIHILQIIITAFLLL